MNDTQFLDTLNVAEAAADVTVRSFMDQHLRDFHAGQLTTKQKLAVAGVACVGLTVAAACTPVGRSAVKGAVTKTRCKLARFFAPKVTHPEDPAVDVMAEVVS